MKRDGQMDAWMNTWIDRVFGAADLLGKLKAKTIVKTDEKANGCIR